MTLNAILIAPNMTKTVQLEPGLAPLQAVIGGDIELLPTDDSVTMFIRAEGKLERLRRNFRGEAMWARVDEYGCLAGGDWMAGPVVILGPTVDGETTDCPPAVYDLLGLPQP